MLQHWYLQLPSPFYISAMQRLYMPLQGKIQILEDQSATSELGAFRDLEMFTRGNTQVEDEIEILNSRSNMIEVARKLGLNLKIIAKGQIHDTELYKDAAPFKVNFLIPDSLVYLVKGRISDKDHFRLLALHLRTRMMGLNKRIISGVR